MKPGAIALTLFIIIAGVTVFLVPHGDSMSTLSGGGSGEVAKNKITVRGIIGSEKKGFLENSELLKLFQSGAVSDPQGTGIIVEAPKTAPSLDMVIQNNGDVDYIWPSNSHALELYKQRLGSRSVGEVNVFNSPIVYYTWADIAETLQKAGLVKDEGGVLYLTGLKQLIGMIDQRKTWQQAFGSTAPSTLTGEIMVYNTDPRASSSGLLHVALIANMLNGGTPPNVEQATALIPRIKHILERQGHQEDKSASLFGQFLSQGEGSFPFVAAYESQMIEFYLQNPKLQDTIKQEIRVLYPVPTIWSAHPLIPKTSAGKQFAAALMNPKVQAIAWEQHGFRTGLVSNVSPFQGLHIAPRIRSVVHLPEFQAMEVIRRALPQQ